VSGGRVFTPYREDHIRANKRADSATSALVAPLIEGCSAIALRIQNIRQKQRMLRTGVNAKTTAFTETLIDGDFSLYHGFLTRRSVPHVFTNGDASLLGRNRLPETGERNGASPLTHRCVLEMAQAVTPEISIDHEEL
jgi:hypothetical protein